MLIVSHVGSPEQSGFHRSHITPPKCCLVERGDNLRLAVRGNSLLDNLVVVYAERVDCERLKQDRRQVSGDVA